MKKILFTAALCLTMACAINANAAASKTVTLTGCAYDESHGKTPTPMFYLHNKEGKQEAIFINPAISRGFDNCWCSGANDTFIGGKNPCKATVVLDKDGDIEKLIKIQK